MQFYDVAQQSLAHSGSSVAEEYIPLWMADGTTISMVFGTSIGTIFLNDGSTSTTSTNSSRLHTLNSSWSNSTKFAFEATISIASSSYSTYASLWDFTNGTQVTSSQVTTTSTTITVVRSPQFTLIPGHTYGVTIWSNTTNTSGTISDASLIVFGQ